MKAPSFLPLLLSCSLAFCKPIIETSEHAKSAVDDSLRIYTRPSVSEPAQWWDRSEDVAAAPPPQILDTDPSKLQSFYQMFTFIDSPDSKWPKNEMNMVSYALVEALEVLYLIGGKLDKASSSTELPSFLRYFPPSDFDAVKTLLSGVLSQFGGMRAEWTQPCALDPKLLPMKLYYDRGPPGITLDRDLCESTRNTPGDQTLAHFNENDYPGQPAGEKGIMIICKYYFDGLQRPSFSVYRTLGQLDCDNVGSFATAFGLDRVKSNGNGGMDFAGGTLLHEILHWKAFSTIIPPREPPRDQLDDLTFTTSRGREEGAYGPWLSQELKRVQPSLAALNVENYIWWLSEEYWRERCSVDFVDTPYENRRD